MEKIDVKALIAQAKLKVGEVNVPRVPRDKKLHLGLGVLAVIAAVVVSAVWQYAPGFALALASTAMGIGYEAQQKFRGEGDVSVWDAAFTAAPGFLAWGAWEAFGRLAG